MRKKHLITTNEILNRFHKIHGDKYIYNLSGNEKQTDYIDILCKKHNYIFKQRVVNHAAGHGCPICNSGRQMTTEEFIIKARDIHGDLYDYSKVDYKGKSVPVIIKCKIHGEFLQKPHDHIGGCGCPYCKIWKTQQKLYDAITKAFPNEEWKWEYKADWLGLQRIDIFNERINLAIEYNGRQHYMPVKAFGGEIGYKQCIERDIRKKKILEEHGCILYVIPYDNYNLDVIINDIKTFLNYENC